MLDGRGILPPSKANAISQRGPIEGPCEIPSRMGARCAIYAEILDVFQDFLTWQGGKGPGQTAFNACEYSF